MKSVMISIKPNWCELIASGKKTLEIRKTKPNLETPFKCYIYCTKEFYNSDYIPKNGRVIGEFVCDNIMRHCNMQNADLAEQQGMIRRELLFDYANGKELFG